MSTVAPQHRELVEGLLKNHAAAKVRNLLATIDIHYSARSIDKVLAEMMARGDREPLRGGVGEPICAHVDHEAAERGCRALLQAQIRAGQVFPTTMMAWRERHREAA